VGIVDRGVAVGHLDMAPAFERREQHEQIGGAVALVLVVDTGRPSRIGIGARVSAMSCLEVSSRQTSTRSGHGAACRRPARPPSATKALLAFGGMTQHCQRCGLRRFF
jgi:hypothetical protein